VISVHGLHEARRREEQHYVRRTNQFLPRVATAMLVLAMGVLGAPPAAKAEQSLSTLTVSVQFVVHSGVPPARGRGAVSPRVLPAVGVATWAVPAGGPMSSPQATATTDAAGVASFTLPAGTYWVVVPRLTSLPPGIPGGAIATELPDGTPVQGWTRVDVLAEASADASIRLTVPLP
jgi:hypothetical protein